MQKPDLNRMWDTLMKIPMEDLSSGRHVDIIRSKIYPVISNLLQKKIINWYFFLIHRNPKNKQDPNLYFHIRLALKRGVDPETLRKSLPSYCVFTQPIKRSTLESISGIDKSLLKNQKIEEAWRIMGEQSEWLLNMLNNHKVDVEIPIGQVEQFLHFYSNMTGLSKRARVQIKCPLCNTKFLINKDVFFMRE